MKILSMLCSILPFYVYLIAGVLFSAYMILDLHIKMKEEIKECKEDKINFEFEARKLFKKRSIMLTVIIMVLAVALAIFSYLGA